MERLLRPYGLVIDGQLELGLEVALLDGSIREVRPHTGIPDPFVISPAFINAHSHLEYRGMQGLLREEEYWPWLREITVAKRAQTLEEVQNDANLAAQENRQTGVGLIAEHSDRPAAGLALRPSGVGGVIFQEVITRFEREGPDARLTKAIEESERQGNESGLPAFLAAHAYHTVDDQTLSWFGASHDPFSMHVAETDLENELTLSGTGAIAETLRNLGVTYEPTGHRLIPTLDELGLVRRGAQFVHCCALDINDIALVAARGVSVAHCPRSNVRLKCPPMLLREMIDYGVKVGLGLDSAASSGPIDMFGEMRAALSVSVDRGCPVSAEEVWRIATNADCIRFALPSLPSWRIEPGSSVPLIKINVGDALSTEDLLERARPDLVEWVGAFPEENR